MAAFYIGQRVRIRYVVDADLSHLTGAETFITGGLAKRYHWDGVSRFCYLVAIDDDFAPEPDQLEPIIPEGLESLEEINALYEPQGETA